MVWQYTVDIVEILGFVGLALVFISFVVKRWTWLYAFNMSGAAILTLYAYLRRNLIFTILEGGLVIFLLKRLIDELKSRKSM